MTVGRPFEKGKSGNPGGRPAMSEEARRAFESMEPVALAKLREILEGDDNALALRAIETVIERRMGKVVQSVAMGDDDGPLRITVEYAEGKKT
jgi:hypothetical protein